MAFTRPQCPPLSSPKEEFLAGSRYVTPVLIGTIPFGFVAGVASISAGMTPFEGIALSVLSFSGIAQLIAAQLYAAGSPVIVTVAPQGLHFHRTGATGAALGLGGNFRLRIGRRGVSVIASRLGTSE